MTMAIVTPDTSSQELDDAKHTTNHGEEENERTSSTSMSNSTMNPENITRPPLLTNTSFDTNDSQSVGSASTASSSQRSTSSSSRRRSRRTRTRTKKRVIDYTKSLSKEFGFRPVYKEVEVVDIGRDKILLPPMATVSSSSLSPSGLSSSASSLSSRDVISGNQSDSSLLLDSTANAGGEGGGEGVGKDDKEASPFTATPTTKGNRKPSSPVQSRKEELRFRPSPRLDSSPFPLEDDDDDEEAILFVDDDDESDDEKNFAFRAATATPSAPSSRQTSPIRHRSTSTTTTTTKTFTTRKQAQAQSHKALLRLPAEERAVMNTSAPSTSKRFVIDYTKSLSVEHGFRPVYKEVHDSDANAAAVSGNNRPGTPSSSTEENRFNNAFSHKSSSGRFSLTDDDETPKPSKGSEEQGDVDVPLTPRNSHGTESQTIDSSPTSNSSNSLSSAIMMMMSTITGAARKKGAQDDEDEDKRDSSLDSTLQHSNRSPLATMTTAQGPNAELTTDVSTIPTPLQQRRFSGASSTISPLPVDLNDDDDDPWFVDDDPEDGSLSTEEDIVVADIDDDEDDDVYTAHAIDTSTHDSYFDAADSSLNEVFLNALMLEDEDDGEAETVTTTASTCAQSMVSSRQSASLVSSSRVSVASVTTDQSAASSTATATTVSTALGGELSHLTSEELAARRRALLQEKSWIEFQLERIDKLERLVMVAKIDTSHGRAVVSNSSIDDATADKGNNTNNSPMSTIVHTMSNDPRLSPVASNSGRAITPTTIDDDESNHIVASSGTGSLYERHVQAKQAQLQQDALHHGLITSSALKQEVAARNTHQVTAATKSKSDDNHDRRRKQRQQQLLRLPSLSS